MWIYIVIIAVVVLACSSCSRQKEYPKSDTPPYLMREEKQLVREEKQWRADEVDIKAIEKKVIEIISEQFGADKSEITRETSFINDLNCDSLDTIELVMEFEDEFDMSIPDKEAEKIQTVGAAIDYIINAVRSNILFTRYRNGFNRRATYIEKVQYVRAFLQETKATRPEFSGTVEESVKAITAWVLKLDPNQIKIEDSFTANLGAESVQCIELVAMFEDEFGIEMDEDATLSVETVGKAVEFITQVCKEQGVDVEQ